MSRAQSSANAGWILLDGGPPESAIRDCLFDRKKIGERQEFKSGRNSVWFTIRGFNLSRSLKGDRALIGFLITSDNTREDVSIEFDFDTNKGRYRIIHVKPKMKFLDL